MGAGGPLRLARPVGRLTTGFGRRPSAAAGTGRYACGAGLAARERDAESVAMRSVLEVVLSRSTVARWRSAVEIATAV